MAFTVTNLADLDRALASGARRIKYQDREVDVRSQSDLLRLRRLMRRELGLEPKGRNRRLGSSFSKGLE